MAKMTRRRIGVIVVVLALAVGLFALLAPVVYDYPSRCLGCSLEERPTGGCPQVFQSLTLEYFQYGGVRLATGHYCIARVIHTVRETQFACVLGG